MEGSWNRSSGQTSRSYQPEMEEDAAYDMNLRPIEIVDLEAEEGTDDDDDVVILYDRFEEQRLRRAESPEIVVLAVNPPRPRPEVIDLCWDSGSDSEVEVLEIRGPLRSPVRVSVEKEREGENVPGRFGEEIGSTGKEAVVVAGEETSEGFSLLSVKQELGEVQASSSTFSLENVKKEVQHGHDEEATSLAQSLGKADIAERGNQNSASLED